MINLRTGWRTTVGPAEEPVSLVTAKAHLRVEHGDEDSLISSLIVSARELVESESQSALVTQTRELTLTDFPCGSDPIEIDVGPVQSVTSVQYYDTDGTSRTASGAQLWAHSSPPKIYPGVDSWWPAVECGRAAPVTVTLVLGYGAASAVPSIAKAAVLLILANWYENRGDGRDPNVDANAFGIPPAAARLISILNTKRYR